MDPTQPDEILITVYDPEDENASVVNMDSSQHIQAEIVNIVNTTVFMYSKSIFICKPQAEGTAASTQIIC